MGIPWHSSDFETGERHAQEVEEDDRAGEAGGIEEDVAGNRGVARRAGLKLQTGMSKWKKVRKVECRRRIQSCVWTAGWVQACTYRRAAVRMAGTEHENNDLALNPRSCGTTTAVALGLDC